MIKELTKEQEKLLIQRRKEGLCVGFDTTTHKEQAEAVITKFYKLLKYKEPTFVWCGSPEGIRQRYEKETGEKWNKTFNFWGSLDTYWITFYKFCEEIGVKYDSKNSELLELWHQLSKTCFWWYPFELVCFVSKKPISINIANERLHSETGPSIIFEDGFKIYNLNGVKVPEWVVMTPAEDIESSAIFKEQNVEVRQELIRKIGGKRIVKELELKEVETLTGEELYNTYPVGKYYQQGDVWFAGKNIENLGVGLDKCEQLTQIAIRQGVFYKLYAGELQNLPIRILRMGNPSVTGDEHFEFVFKTCNTIIEAIGFRNQFALKNGGIDWKTDEILLPHVLT